MSRKEIFEEIISERKRQDLIYGNQENHPLSKWVSILTEEVGSVAKQANLFEERGNELNLRKYELEIIQVAAVALAMLESLKINEDKRSTL